MGMNKYILMGVLLMGMLSNAFASEITVRLDENKVMVNESFTVVFASNKKIQDQPDFAPLQKDFEIISTSAGLYTSIINGRLTEETRWNVTLVAKHEGTLTIPSIAFGAYSSPAKDIEVTASVAENLDDAIFIETEMKPNTAIYEQTPLIFTIRLYCSLQMTQGSLSDIKTNDPDTIIERIGNDTQFEKFHSNGKRYVVIERQYMIVPQHAGELIILPAVFEGNIVKRSYSMFDVQTNFKRLYSKEEKIEVKAAPASASKNKWFAANDFKVTEEWSKDINHLSLSEPVTWTLTLTAEGGLANQIPDISFNFPKEIKSYLDKPEVTNHVTQASVKGVKVVKVALIPTKAGEFVLPELAIEWWNLNTNQSDEIIIQKRTIKVEALEEVAIGSPVISEKAITSLPDVVVDEPVEMTRQMMGFLSVAILGAFVLLFSFYMKTKPRHTKSDLLKDMNSDLKQACLSNEAKMAEKYLLSSASLLFPEVKPLNLVAVKPYLTQDLQKEIDDLYQYLYGQKANWIGSSLWQAWKSFKPKKNLRTNTNKKQEDLQRLYPQ